jgi:hypothetical protein
MTTTLTARGPEDLLAAVPVVLGFHPADSLVMLTFGADRTFHARLDLPDSPDDEAIDEAVDALLAPCRSHAVDHVAFVVYTDDRGLAAVLAAALVPAFVADGIGVVDVLRADGGCWSSVPVRSGAEESSPVPYDDTHHPFNAQAVFEGHVTLASRDEVRSTIAMDPVLRRRWVDLLVDQPTPGPADVDRVRSLVARWVASGDGPDDAGAARVLHAITRVDVRDAALHAVARDTARDHLRVWSALLRGAPTPQAAEVAAVTAFCAWQSGHGALAWCALDRCFEIDPGHRLGRYLAECLVRAVPPTTWWEVGEERASGAG